jgi:ABC-type oligopeptide transport system ATPase subunit
MRGADHPEDRPEDWAHPIVIEGLVNRFGDFTVHDGLDLTVRRGEILGVVGGSGTGKSVLMRSIIGLQIPDAGEIEVLGSAITDARDDDDIDIDSDDDDTFLETEEDEDDSDVADLIDGDLEEDEDESDDAHCQGQ